MTGGPQLGRAGNCKGKPEAPLFWEQAPCSAFPGKCTEFRGQRSLPRHVLILLCFWLCFSEGELKSERDASSEKS